jgi:hypothetical protein
MSFATRKSQLQSGVGEGGLIIFHTGTGGTIFSDTAQDTLCGGSDQNWIIH